MDQVCLTIPVLPGKATDARAFLRELDQGRRTDYDQSERRLGITKEVWFFSDGAGSDHLVAYLESPSFAAALDRFVRSREPFDRWFKTRLAEATGLDLNDPPEGMRLPELLSSYGGDATAGADGHP